MAFQSNPTDVCRVPLVATKALTQGGPLSNLNNVWRRLVPLTKPYGSLFLKSKVIASLLIMAESHHAIQSLLAPNLTSAPLTICECLPWLQPSYFEATPNLALDHSSKSPTKISVEYHSKESRNQIDKTINVAGQRDEGQAHRGTIPKWKNPPPGTIADRDTARNEQFDLWSLKSQTDHLPNSTTKSTTPSCHTRQIIMASLLQE